MYPLHRRHYFASRRRRVEVSKAKVPAKLKIDGASTWRHDRGGGGWTQPASVCPPPLFAD